MLTEEQRRRLEDARKVLRDRGASAGDLRKHLALVCSVLAEMALCDMRVLRAVLAERKRQDQQWGDDQHHDNVVWLAILMEEVGEVAEAVLEEHNARNCGLDVLADDHLDDVEKELIQVAAVAVQWLERSFFEEDE